MMKKLMAGLTALLLAVPFAPVLAESPQAPETAAQALQSVYDDERYAQAMYEGLEEQFGEGPFTRLIRAEGHHIAAVERVAERSGVTLIQNEVEVSIPATLEEGIQMAIDYERYDIAMLETLIAKDYSAQMNRMLSNLLRGSVQHEQHMTDYAEAVASGNADGWLPDCGNPGENRAIGRNADRFGRFGAGAGTGLRDPENCRFDTPRFENGERGGRETNRDSRGFRGNGDGTGLCR